MNERFTRAPHHNDDRTSAPSPNAALLIDFDNVTMGIRSNLGQELRQLLNSDIIRGKVSVQRAYADWRRYPQYVVPLSEAAIDLIYAPAYGSSKKNATDIRLAIDALELVFTRPEIGSYILLSGDSDFSSLVLKLKEYGKYVIGVGMQESSSDLLVQNCDEYYSYDSLSGLVSADEMDTQRHDPWELAEHSIRKMVERDDVMRSDRLKQVMLELDPSFDEKEIGYSKFNRFLTEASSRGILKLEKIGNGQYRVGPGSSVDVDGASAGGDAGREERKSSGRGRGKEQDDEPRPPRDLSEEASGTAASGGDREDRGGSDQETSGGGRPSSGGEGGRDRSRGGRRGGGDRPVVEAEQLRAAYDLLRDVVSDLSDDDGRVRDSEVKREMLNRDSSFDEGALGFSKFSRFIRQAHDEEVVDVAKDDDGNYYLSVPGAGSDGARRESESDRGGREAPERAGRGEPSGRAPEPEREEPAERDGSAEPEAEPAASGTEPSPAEPSPAADGGATEADGGGGGRDEPGPGDEASGRGSGLGRRRRKGGGGARSDSDGDGDSWVPGPVDSGGGDGGDGPEVSAGTPGGSSGGSGRRGVGRFRRGSKSGAKGSEGDSGEEPTPGPVTTDAGADEDAGDPASDARPEPTSDGEAAGAPNAEPDADAGSGPTSDRAADRGNASRSPAGAGGSDDLVGHMKDHYSGVGEKTARALVEEFGDRTLSVIDDDPRRVRDLLPKHRAEAVLQARQAERERGGRDARG